MVFMRFCFVFLTALFVFLPSSQAMQAIVAVVNEDAISARDLEKRMRLVIVSSGLPNKPEIRQRLLPQVLNALIDEQLMLQEAARARVEVTDDEIESGFSRVAQQNKIDVNQFRATLSRSGVDISTLRSQIRAQIAWSKFVQRRLRSRVIVSERDIDDAYERIVAKMGSTEFLTAEIFLPTTDNNSQEEALQLARRLSAEIKSGRASFFQLAQQFSKSAGSAQGGNVGWLNEAQMDQDLLVGLEGVQKNQITEPIKTSEGYHILFLRNVRTVDDDSVPSRDQIGFNLGSQRLEKVQRRHLQDLKASAFVDIRV